MQIIVSCIMGNSGCFKIGRTETEAEKAFRVQRLKEAWENNPRKHGMMNTKFYNSWRSMTTRCRGTAGKDSRRKYRDRGITVCERWLTFRNFYDDMFESYSEGLTIDRINDAKVYSKETCKWSTAKEQANNRRNSLKIDGLTLEELAIKLQIPYGTLRNRYYRLYKKGKITKDQLIRDENKLL